MQFERNSFVWQYVAAIAAILVGALVTSDMAYGAGQAMQLGKFAVSWSVGF